MTKLEALWAQVRDSLWFLPGLLTASGVLLAFAMSYLDETMPPGPLDHPFVFVGGADGALSVLSSIATSLIAVTGVTFSVTIVARQLASAQYTPRVLRNFMADRSNQLVLGVFIATFTYSLLIQRRVRIGTDGSDAFIPSFSVTGAVVLVLLSVVFLIYFIDHLARSIQASMIIDRVTQDTLVRIQKLFPEPIGVPVPEEGGRHAVDAPPEAVVVTTERGGYLQAVDESSLFDLAEHGQLTVRMEVRIGEFLMPGQPIATVWPPTQRLDAVRAQVREAFVLGAERTPQQDVEHGIIELVDIAVRALSPSINDPETAKNGIDRLGEVLAVLGGRAFPAVIRVGAGGDIRFIARRMTYADAATLAFGPLRHFGADNPWVVLRLVETIRKVAAVVPAQRRAPLAAELELVWTAARAKLTQASDVAPIESAVVEARIALGVPVSADGRQAA